MGGRSSPVTTAGVSTCSAKPRTAPLRWSEMRTMRRCTQFDVGERLGAPVFDRFKPSFREEQAPPLRGRMCQQRCVGGWRVRGGKGRDTSSVSLRLPPSPQGEGKGGSANRGVWREKQPRDHRRCVNVLGEAEDSSPTGKECANRMQKRWRVHGGRTDMSFHPFYGCACPYEGECANMAARCKKCHRTSKCDKKTVDTPWQKCYT